MSAALIGNMEWLKANCSSNIRRNGWQVSLLSGEESFAHEIVQKSDAVIVVTDHVSHQARQKVLAVCRNKVPVFMRHSCGACHFRSCLDHADCR